MDEKLRLTTYRNSISYILAKALVEIYGNSLLNANGLETKDGLYYDFFMPEDLSFSDKEFPKIEDKILEIIRRKDNFLVEQVSKEEAKEIFKNNKFKLEIIDDLESEKVNLLKIGDEFIDIKDKDIVEDVKYLNNLAYSIYSTSMAYWKGNEKGERLQRIYLYIFSDKKELKNHIKLIEEAKARDHKKIGKELELFMFDDSAPGMPYWYPRGWIMYQALLKFSRELQAAHGYQEISAPIINNKKLWLVSGHWAHYIDNMFIIPGITGHIKYDANIENVYKDLTDNSEEAKTVKIEEGSVIYNREDLDTMAAKPMNCPNAMTTYKSKKHSYKELPIRYSEYDVLHRKEKSGQMNGLFRVQEFRQDDDHTFVMQSQIKEEIADIISIADEIYSTFGVSYKAELSTRPDDFMGEKEVWDEAEKSLKEILDEKYGPEGYEINEGDGAFYGPKIDLQIEDALGRQWQCGTIQLDFQLPHNFGLTYTSSEGKEEMPVVIHRAIYGSLERFIGIIIENFKGIFPFWLNPYQVAVVPIREEHNDYAKEVAKKLVDNGIRVEADYSDKNMRNKIKEFKQMKDPYILVVGDKEAENNTVSVNIRGTNKQVADVYIDKFIEVCKKLNKEHILDLIDEF